MYISRQFITGIRCLRRSITLMIIVTFFTSTAFAQNADSGTEDFASLIDRAKTAFTEKKYEDAITFLQKANRVQPDARLWMNIARSYEKLDDCVSMLGYYRAVTEDKEVDGDIKKLAKKQFKKRKRKCKAFDSNLSGRVTIGSEPEGAAITFNDKDIGPGPVEMITIKPGEYTVKFALEGYKPSKQTFEITDGKSADIYAELEKIEEKKPEENDPDDTTDTPDDKIPDDDQIEEPIDPGTGQDESGSSINIPAIALIGVGVVGLGVGAYFDLAAIPATDEDRAKFAQGTQEFNDLTDQRKSQATIALASYIGGGVLLAGGLTWLIIDMVGGDEGEKSEDEIKVFRIAPTPVITKDYAGLGLSGRF